MRSLWLVLKEHKNNLYMLNRLALTSMQTQYSATVLGNIWLLLSPMLQIGVYWLAFGVGIRGGAPVGTIPFVIWLICGIIPWFFISSSLTRGSGSIYQRLKQVSKMNFPLSIIPTYTILSNLYTHLLLLLVLFFVLLCNISSMQIDPIGLLYYIFSNIMFVWSISFLTSTISTMLRDFHFFMQQIVRMLFYLTPILWEVKSSVPSWFLFIIQLNPIYYLINGYRTSLLSLESVTPFVGQTLLFWGFTGSIFFIGVVLHVRFRKNFVEYI
ncbi:MAG TPA: ABC transporter permease [Firmicutes bacterium]|nr:ABC transporter permease [Bacillales bacterium]HJA41411.1 ABC transporter permease [Bacillota bacterium]